MQNILYNQDALGWPLCNNFIQLASACGNSTACLATKLEACCTTTEPNEVSTKV